MIASDVLPTYLQKQNRKIRVYGAEDGRFSRIVEIKMVLRAI